MKKKIEKKKLLAVLGSPHKNGRCAVMLEAMVKAAKEAGWEVDFVDLYEKNIGYCKGCFACMKTEKCVMQDDLQEIAELVKNCDVIALAAPTYWANVPAVVKNVFDRMFGTAMEETKTFPRPRLSRSQKYFLITSCNTPSPFSWLFGQSRGSIRAMREFFKTAGMSFGGKYVYTNAKRDREQSQVFERKVKRLFSVQQI